MEIIGEFGGIAIEPGNWGLHKKNIKRDAEKRKRCQDKGIRLITIYDKFDGVESRSRKFVKRF